MPIYYSRRMDLTEYIIIDCTHYNFYEEAKSTII